MPVERPWRSAFCGLALGVFYPVSHTLWITDRVFESVWGPLQLLAVFALSWILLGVLEAGGRTEIRWVGVLAGSGYAVTWMLYLLAGGSGD